MGEVNSKDGEDKQFSTPGSAQESQKEPDLKERTEKVSSFLKTRAIPKLKNLPESFWAGLVVLAIALFGFFIRIASLARLKLDWAFPFLHLEKMSTLIDITTGRYISMELDSTLVMRYVKEFISNGMLAANDALRYYPVGFDPRPEFSVLIYLVSGIHKVLSFFIPSIPVELSVDLYPAIAFFFGLIFFYLAVKKLFGVKVAVLASLLLTVVPSYLYRTVSGVSDKEAMSMALLFLSFYLFVSAWKSKGRISALAYGVGSGIVTGANSLVWGGTGFVYFIFGLFMLIVIILDKFSEIDFFAYTGWFIPTVYFATQTAFSRTSVGDMAVSVTSGAMFFAFTLAVVDFVVFKRDLFKVRSRIEHKLPLGMANFFISLVLVIVLTSALFGLNFIPGKIGNTVHSLIYPLGDRWSLTVAESHEPYVADWFGQMGSTYVLLLLVAGVVLFYDTFAPLKKYRMSATLAYSVLLLLFIFSRYSSGSQYLNGTSNVAKFLYVGPLVGFFLIAIGVYVYSFLKKKDLFEHFKDIKKEYIFVFIWFMIMIMGARRIVRLIFVFSSVSAVLVSYVLVRAYSSSENMDKYEFWSRAGFFSLISLVVLLVVDKLFVFLKLSNDFYFDSRLKTVIILALLIGFSSAAVVKKFSGNLLPVLRKSFKVSVVVLVALLVFSMSSSTIGTAKALGPSYHSQWQAAGGWVRENLPEDAVFAHWWDYGYWVQANFERASITDGGNAMGSWNHYMGRYLLTSPNDNETLEFLNTHDATHILFVPDEVGKYPAFSSIGADSNYDRYSWISVFQLDPKQTIETRNGTVFVYVGSTGLDDDFVYQGKAFPAKSSGIAGFFVPVSNADQETGLQAIEQPAALLVYGGQTTKVPLNCLYIAGQKVEFNNPDGLDGCLRIMPDIANQNGVGAGLYLSPDVSKSLFARLYLFDEHKTNPNYELVYSDDKTAPVGLYPFGFHGPIRIWKINYPEGTPKNEAYLSTAYIDPSVTKI